MDEKTISITLNDAKLKEIGRLIACEYSGTALPPRYLVDVGRRAFERALAHAETNPQPVAQPTAQIDWQPISTAPRDETNVLLFTKVGIVQAYYVPSSVSQTLDGPESEGAVWLPLDERVSAFEVEDVRQPDGSMQYRDGIVTHWAPLPNLPVLELHPAESAADDATPSAAAEPLDLGGFE